MYLWPCEGFSSPLFDEDIYYCDRTAIVSLVVFHFVTC